MDTRGENELGDEKEIDELATKLVNLNDELIIETFRHLIPETIIALSLVNRRFYHLSRNNDLWRYKFGIHFPHRMNTLVRREDTSNSQLDWFTEFKNAYQADYAPLLKDRNLKAKVKLFSYAKENDLNELQKANVTPDNAVSLSDYNNITLRDWIFHQKHQPILDYFYSIEKEWLEHEEDNLGLAVNKHHSKGFTFLHCAAMYNQTHALSSLIKSVDDANQADEFGVTPLLIAAEKGHIEVVKELIAKGANVNQADTKNIINTPLLIAAENGHSDVVKELIAKGANINQINNVNQTPLRLAVCKGHLEVVKVLLGTSSDVSKSLQSELTFAIESGHYEVLKELISKGADVNHPDERGNTPLFEAIRFNKIDIVKELIARGADVNANVEDETPLFLAVDHGYFDLVKELIANGANVEFVIERIDEFEFDVFGRERDIGEIMRLLNEYRLEKYLNDQNTRSETPLLKDLLNRVSKSEEINAGLQLLDVIRGKSNVDVLLAYKKALKQGVLNKICKDLGIDLKNIKNQSDSPKISK